MASLFLLRHAETALNKKKGPTGKAGGSVERIRGHVDVPLDAAGKREVLAAAAKYSQMRPARVYSSDLQRAHDTALPLARAVQVPLITTAQLRPWKLGILTGQPVKEVVPLMNKLVEHPEVRVPDGELSRGESFQSFADRYLPFLRRLIAEAAQSGRPIFAVTHSRNLQLAAAWDKAGRPETNSWDAARMADYKQEVEPCGTFELAPGGHLKVVDHGQTPKA